MTYWIQPIGITGKRIRNYFKYKRAISALKC